MFFFFYEIGVNGKYVIVDNSFMFIFKFLQKIKFKYCCEVVVCCVGIMVFVVVLGIDLRQGVKDFCFELLRLNLKLDKYKLLNFW